MSSWRKPLKDIVMNGSLEELQRRIKENEGRGFTLISEPQSITTVFDSKSYSYADLKRIKFTGTQADVRTKWTCKMRLTSPSVINSQESIAKMGNI